MLTDQPKLAARLMTAIACFTLMIATGCVGPMACGPSACGVGGPIALNSCDGCGDCNGCGELYVDPWINEGHNCVDPCDQCGNHNGQSCGRCRSVFGGFASLWGYRRDAGCGDCGSVSCGGGCGGGCGSPLRTTCGGCDSGCGGCEPACGMDSGCDAGCTSCGSHGGVGHDVIHMDGGSLPPGSYVEGETIYQDDPTPAYQPRRTRQIFTPRGSVAESNGGTRDF